MTETELVNRLEKLERDNRRLKRLGGAVLVLAAVFGAVYSARPIPEKITAREFDVADASGNVRIRLRVDNKYGIASVSVLGSDGKAVAQMIATSSAGSRSGSISVQDLEGNSAVMSEGSAFPSGILLIGKSASVALDNKNEKERLAANGLEFFSQTGRPTISLISAENSGGLEFYGKQNQKIGNYSFPVARMQLNDWGLDFNKADGTTVIELGGIIPGSPTAIPALGLYGKSPLIILSDDQGYSLDLGSTVTQTPPPARRRTPLPIRSSCLATTKNITSSGKHRSGGGGAAGMGACKQS